MALEPADDVHGADGLAIGVLGVRHGIALDSESDVLEPEEPPSS